MTTDSGSPQGTEPANGADVVVSSQLQPLQGPAGPAGAAGATGATGLPGLVRVNHGAVASTARPSTANVVLWVGSVVPANWDTAKDLFAQT